MELTGVLNLVESMIDNRDEFIESLNIEIDRVQARYTVLCAMRDALLPDSEPEAACEPNEATPAAASSSDIEAQILDHITAKGAMSPGDLAQAIGVHHTKIGRVVNASQVLVKQGKLVVRVA